MNSQSIPGFPVSLQPVLELEAMLEQLIGQHQKLLAQVSAHHSAMTVLDLPTMDQTKALQHATRVRIIDLDQQRRSLTQQIARTNMITGEAKLQQLAEIFPARGAQLLRLRDELQSVVTEAARQSYVASRLASAVLGHLNTAVRILARAVGDSGVYNGRGMATVSKRLGRMEITG